jgi:hypothetical protein
MEFGRRSRLGSAADFCGFAPTHHSAQAPFHKCFAAEAMHGGNEPLMAAALYFGHAISVAKASSMGRDGDASLVGVLNLHTGSGPRPQGKSLPEKLPLALLSGTITMTLGLTKEVRLSDSDRDASLHRERPFGPSTLVRRPTHRAPGPLRQPLDPYGVFSRHRTFAATGKDVGPTGQSVFVAPRSACAGSGSGRRSRP